MNFLQKPKAKRPRRSAGEAKLQPQKLSDNDHVDNEAFRPWNTAYEDRSKKKGNDIAGVGEHQKTATGVRFTLTRNGKPIEPTGYKPEKVKIDGSTPGTKTVKMKDGSWDRVSKCGRFITATSPPNPVSARFGHSLVGAILSAYDQHCTLKLRPDDIWLTLMVTFGLFIDAKPEEMRHCFVDHKDKKELVIKTLGNFYSLNWQGLSSLFAELIAKNTKDTVKEWVVPNFSTTTEKDRFIGSVMFMGSMKNYFSYGAWTMCGIPAVIMEGTLEDWQKLRDKIDRFKKYGEDANLKQLIDWHAILVPILDEFLRSYKGKVNADFWQQCRSWRTFGSGASTYVDGWINGFVPFNQNGSWNKDSVETILHTRNYGSLDHNYFPGYASIDVPVKVNDNGTMHDACLLVGGLVNNYDEETNTISPSFDVIFYEMEEGSYADDIKSWCG